MAGRPRVQVVVAHPDDETFGCGSILVHAKAAGAVTAVCCATRGEAGGSGGDLAAARERELYRAAAVLGVDRVDLLCFTDSCMTGEAGCRTLAGAPFERVQGCVGRAVGSFRPDVLVTLDAGDGHRDHARIRDAAIAAAREVGVPRIYECCLPRSLLQRWIDHMRTARPDIDYLDAEIAAVGTPDEQITTVLDGERFLPARERAIAVHASQTSPFEGLPGDLRHAFLAADHLRRVDPPWTGGAHETSLFG